MPANYFEPGRLVATPAALAAVPIQELMEAYGRHLNCDWGDLSEEDRLANNAALKSGYRLLSVYRNMDGTKFWIITEADRSYTTLLLPQDY